MTRSHQTFPSGSLSILGFALFWNYAFLDTLALHGPLRVLGVLTFASTLLPLCQAGASPFRSWLDHHASRVAPLLFLTGFGSFLAYLGPLSLPPELPDDVQASLVWRLYASLAVMMGCVAVMARWLWGRGAALVGSRSSA